MANAFYDAALDDAGKIGVGLKWNTNGGINVLGIDASAYTFDPSHLNLANVPAIARHGFAAFTLTTVAGGGICDGSDITYFNLIDDAKPLDAFIVLRTIGAGPERLIAYIDTAPGLPIAPGTSTTCIIQWDPAGILKLG